MPPSYRGKKEFHREKKWKCMWIPVQDVIKTCPAKRVTRELTRILDDFTEKKIDLF